jgi:hypothetical protein
MYLFIFPDRTLKQVSENLTIIDIMSVRTGCLSIVRSTAAPAQRYDRLVIDNGKLCWVPVREAGVVGCQEGAIHL